MALSDDSPGFYQSTTSYTPGGDERPGSVVPLEFPWYLASDEADTKGEMPFRWEDGTTSGPVARGQWFLDPAFAIGTRLTFPETFSDQYCFNPFFSIDNRGESDCE